MEETNLKYLANIQSTFSGYYDFRDHILKRYKQASGNIITSSDVKFARDTLIVDGTAIFPENAIVFMDKGLYTHYEMLFKFKGFLCDSYPSSVHISGRKESLLLLLQNYVLTPEIYYDFNPSKGKIINYTIYGASTIPNKYCSIRGAIDDYKDYLPVLKMYCYMGRPLSIVKTLYTDQGFLASYGDKYLKFIENVMYPADPSPTSFVTEDEKKEFEEYYDKIDIDEEELVCMAEEVSRLLMLGSCEVNITPSSKQGVMPYVIDVHFTHSPAFRWFFKDEKWYDIMWTAFQELINTEELEGWSTDVDN